MSVISRTLITDIYLLNRFFARSVSANRCITKIVLIKLYFCVTERFLDYISYMGSNIEHLNIRIPKTSAKDGKGVMSKVLSHKNLFADNGHGIAPL